MTRTISAFPAYLCGIAILLLAPTANATPTNRGLSNEQIAQLNLGPKQKQQVKHHLEDAQKHRIKLQADIEVAGIELQSELAKDSISEDRVSRLIEKISSLEGKMRKSRVLSWVRVRKLLSAEQRRLLGSQHSDNARADLRGANRAPLLQVREEARRLARQRGESSTTAKEARRRRHQRAVQQAHKTIRAQHRSAMERKHESASQEFNEALHRATEKEMEHRHQKHTDKAKSKSMTKSKPKNPNDK